jgi:hypothetical protein
VVRALAVAVLTTSFGAQASSRQKTDPTPRACDPKRLETSLREFTKDPHPFGSAAQLDYAKALQAKFPAPDWKMELLTFSAKSPAGAEFSLVRFPTQTVTRRTPAPPKERIGANVLATRMGSESCAVLLAGHFDTKFYPNFRFVGANDGGSSTALLLELAHVIPSHAFKQGTWGSCTLHLALFDGEEAILPEWNDGESTMGLIDHLYGSRNFALTRIGSDGTSKTLDGRRLALAFIIDMVGHRNQALSITKGSDAKATKSLLAVRESVSIQKSDEFVEDDHSPFLALGVPVLHLIDWTNLGEWHTPRDTIKIISTEKLASLGDVLIRFLKQNRG